MNGSSFDFVPAPAPRTYKQALEARIAKLESTHGDRAVIDSYRRELDLIDRACAEGDEGQR